MPQNFFTCPNCGTLDLVTYRSRDTDDPEVWPPICSTPECFEVRMVFTPQPGDFHMDAKEPFQRFTVHRQVPTKDGLMQVEETIDSTHKMRLIEKDSEQRYRDGEGEPLRFRMLSQNRSNKDVGAFGTEGSIGDRHYDSGKAPEKKSNIGIERHGQKKPRIKTARGGGKTALKG